MRGQQSSQAGPAGAGPPDDHAAPVCPRCGLPCAEAMNFCHGCGADLRGIGAETDTLVGVHFGRIIDGRYRLLDRLGEGGMGSVFKAEHVHMGKVCAVKVLKPERAGRDGGLRERFRQEARIVSRLVHVNTIQVFDFGEDPDDDGALYLVMEYARGRSLAEVLREGDGRLSEQRMVAIAVQILRSLAEAHEAGIVHRDIKPQNLMILDLRDRKDFVKVLDFGIAKLVGTAGGRTPTTGIGEIVGTPTYLSPEQARGEALDARTDLYSLGAMMFECLTGRAPYVAETPLGVVTAHLTEPIPDPEAVAPGAVTPKMAGILRRALAKAREDRFDSADAMRAALEAIAEQRIQTPSIPDWSFASEDTGELSVASREDFERFEQYERRLARRRVLAPVMALMVVAALGAGTWWGLDQITGPVTNEREPNDDPQSANRIIPEVVPDLDTLMARATAVGEDAVIPLRTVTGHLGQRLSERAGDEDWFRFTVPEGEASVLYVEVTGIPNIDSLVEVYGPRPDDPGRLTVLARSDAPGPGAFEGIASLALSPGDYFVRVAQVEPVVAAERLGLGETQKGAGLRRLPVENVSDPYRLTLALRPLLESEAPGPAWLPEEAAGLVEGEGRLAFPGVVGTRTWWRLDPPTAGHRHVVSVNAPAQVMLTIRAYEATDAGPPEAQPIAEAAADRFGEDLRLVIPRRPGDPALLVAVETAGGSSLLEPYVIESTPEPVPAAAGRRRR